MRIRKKMQSRIPENKKCELSDKVDARGKIFPFRLGCDLAGWGGYLTLRCNRSTTDLMNIVMRTDGDGVTVPLTMLHPSTRVQLIHAPPQTKQRGRRKVIVSHDAKERANDDSSKTKWVLLDHEVPSAMWINHSQKRWWKSVYGGLQKIAMNTTKYTLQYFIDYAKKQKDYKKTLYNQETKEENGFEILKYEDVFTNTVPISFMGVVAHNLWRRVLPAWFAANHPDYRILSYKNMKFTNDHLMKYCWPDVPDTGGPLTVYLPKKHRGDYQFLIQLTKQFYQLRF